MSDTARTDKFRTFEDLELYKFAREFRKAMYKAARSLPDIEKYALCSQIRCAARSLTNNIAEGHGHYHFGDHIYFVLQVRGSLQELIDDLNICADESYLEPNRVSELREQAWQVLKVMNGYLRYLRDSKPGKSLPLREDETPYRTHAVHEGPFNSFNPFN
jgi:four helix bundle protein